MPLSLQSPLFALLAALLALAALLLAFLPHRSPRTRLTLLLPLLAAAAAALAAAHPALTTQSPIILLLDCSASTRNSPLHNPDFVRGLALDRLGPNQPITLVAFDAQPRLLAQNILPSDPTAWPHTLPDGLLESNAAAALAWSTSDERNHPTRPRAARWLITDGLLTLPPDPPLFACTLLPPTDPDLAITAIHAQPAGQDVEILLQLRATGYFSTRLQLRRDNLLLADQPITFPASPSSRWLTLRDTSPPANHPLHYTATLPSSDPIPADVALSTPTIYDHQLTISL